MYEFCTISLKQILRICMISSRNIFSPPHLANHTILIYQQQQQQQQNSLKKSIPFHSLFCYSLYGKINSKTQ